MKVFIPIFLAAGASAFSVSNNSQQLQQHHTSSSITTMRYNIIHQSRCTALKMSAEEMEVIALDAEERMDKTMSNLAENLSTIRTGKSVLCISIY